MSAASIEKKMRGEVLCLLNSVGNGSGRYSKHLLNINKHKVKKRAQNSSRVVEILRTAGWRETLNNCISAHFSSLKEAAFPLPPFLFAHVYDGISFYVRRWGRPPISPEITTKYTANKSRSCSSACWFFTAVSNSVSKNVVVKPAFFPLLFSLIH